MSLIVLDHVTHTFANDTHALHDVSLSIEQGDFVFLQGPSGSGKTTILKLLIKQLTPSSGNIFFDGTQVNKKRGVNTAQLRRKIGICFQDMKLLTDRTIGENVAVMLEITGTKKSEIPGHVKAALDLVGLVDKMYDFPVQLSGGEIQRIGLARAIVADPLVVFADEPTANLDEESSWRIMSLLKEIHRRSKTVIVATHNLEIIQAMQERVIQLEKGKLIATQSPNSSE